MNVVNAEKNKSMDKFLAFLLGIGVSEGITVLFYLSNKPFSFIEVLSPLMFIYFCVRDGYALPRFIRSVSIGFKLFFLIIVASIIPGIIYFMSFSVIQRYMVGLITLIISLTAAFNAFILNKQRQYIFRGIFIGFILNIVFSLICFVSFQGGVVISLEEFFNRDSFYTPEYSFRAQGFFLEPSHFIRYVGSVVLLLVSSIRFKSSIIKYVIVFSTIAVLGLSLSGSVVIVIVGVVLYYFSTMQNKRGIRPRDIVLFLLFVVALFAFFSKISEVMYKIMTGANIIDEENAGRFGAILSVLSQWEALLIGCGWNLTANVIESANLNIPAAFSDIVEMSVETGIIGGLLYVCSVLVMAWRLWKVRDNYSRALSVSLLMILALQAGTDYAINPCIMLVFGLCFAADFNKGQNPRLIAQERHRVNDD